MSDQTVIVVGAGIVGTATARALQRAGHSVILLDSAEPGRATSYGNAGFIAIDHVLPLARPSTLKRVPKMLMDRNGPLTVHPPSLPWLLPWMARFARAAYSPAEVRKGVDAFGPLMAEANIAWKAEIQASGLGELFKSRGALYVYESEAAFAAGDEERTLQRAKGTEFDFDVLLKNELDKGVTNVRNTANASGGVNAHWRPWLGPANRCVVPFTSFSEPDQDFEGTRKPIWFALSLTMFLDISKLATSRNYINLPS